MLTRLVRDKLSRFWPECGVILRPQWTYNYKIHRQDVHQRFETQFRDVLDSGGDDDEVVKEILEKLPKPLFIISFPVIERTSVHLHSVLGHEIGHALAQFYREPAGVASEFFAETRAQYQSSAPPSKSKRSKNAVTSELPFEDIPEVKVALESRRMAIRELAADAAGVLLFGISSLLGAAHHALSKNPDGRREVGNSSYPSWGVRIVEMLRLAREMGWLSFESLLNESNMVPATQSVIKRITLLEEYVGDDPHAWLDPNEWCAKGQRSALKQLPAVNAFLKDKFQSGFADRDRVYNRLPVLFARLQSRIPPDNLATSEVNSEQPDLADILTVTWWDRISNLNPTFEAGGLDSGTLLKSSNLRDLSLKAIDSIVIVDRFRRST